MALADIISRIESDARAEADRIVREAQDLARRRAEEALGKTRAQAERLTGRMRRETEVEAATRVAAARLAARDEAVAKKRELVDAALEATVASLEALPAEEFARFIAQAIAAQARCGDTVSLAPSEQRVRAAVQAAVESLAPGLELTWADEPAAIERGAVVSSQRTRVEVTPRALVEDRRGELELMVAAKLFGVEGT